MHCSRNHRYLCKYVVPFLKEFIIYWKDSLINQWLQYSMTTEVLEVCKRYNGNIKEKGPMSFWRCQAKIHKGKKIEKRFFSAREG